MESSIYLQIYAMGELIEHSTENGVRINLIKNYDTILNNYGTIFKLKRAVSCVFW